MLKWLAEKRIQEAMDRGEFDNYAGKGKPFPEDFFVDNPYVPSEARNSFLGMKGFTPHALILKREIDVMRVQIKSKFLSPEERNQLMKEVSLKEAEYQARVELLRD